MKRRSFIAGLGGAAVVGPRGTWGQQAKAPTIGFLGTNASVWSSWTAAFVERLRELGGIDGRTVAIEYRWAEGRSEQFSALAAELVRQKVDVVVTYGGQATTLKQATAVVFALSPDPVGSGLVASLAHPGGNATGLSLQAPDIAGKRLELLRDALPDLRRIAILADAGSASPELNYVEAAAAVLGMTAVKLEVPGADNIVSAIDGVKGGADALYVCTGALTTANRVLISSLAVTARLPTLHSQREYAEAGALISYGPNIPFLFRRAAELVDKILRGTKPADIPVEQPTKFDLVVNLTTAKALGLAIPASFLARADEVVE